MRRTPPVDFAEVLPRLSVWREEAVELLRSPDTHAAALAVKRQIDMAIGCLEMCQRFGIHPSSSVTILPDLQTMSPSCAYRIIEDGESDDRRHWSELKTDGEGLRLTPGDVIIEQP